MLCMSSLKKRGQRRCGGRCQWQPGVHWKDRWKKNIFLWNVGAPAINPEYSLEGLMQSFGHLIRRADSLEKTLMLGKIEGRRRRGWQRMRCAMDMSLTQWTWVWASSGRWWRTGKPGVLQSIGSQRVRHNWATEQQQHLPEHHENGDFPAPPRLSAQPVCPLSFHLHLFPKPLLSD